MRRSLIILSGVISIAFVCAALILLYFNRDLFLQKSSEPVRIGILVRGSGYDDGVAGFIDRMETLGYERNRQAIYDIRYVTAAEDLEPTVEEMLKGGVALIHTYSTPATVAAFSVTQAQGGSVPVVFGSMGDPVLSGTVESLVVPGTNVTGVSSLSTELTAKRLELLLRFAPQSSQVAMPHTEFAAQDIAANRSVEVARQAAEALGVALVEFSVAGSEENESVAESITAEVADGIIFGGDSLVWSGAAHYIDRARAEGIPLIGANIVQVENGALASIGPDLYVSGGQAAGIAHKILQGGNPAVIPVAQPERLLVVLNKATADEIGLVLTPETITLIDRIITP